MCVELPEILESFKWLLNTLIDPERESAKIWDTLECSGTLWNTVRFSETLWDTLKDCVTFGSPWSPLPRHFGYKSPSYNDLANIKLSPFIFRNLWSHQIGAGPLEHFLLKEEWWSVTQCCNMSPGGKRKLPDIRLILRVPPHLPTCHHIAVLYFSFIWDVKCRSVM